jgi:uncharacterized membrane protein YfcA
MLYNTLLTLGLGSFSGAFGGALGQSGAETMLPGLLILGLVPNFKTAAGTVLLAIIPPISILAVIEYYKRGQVQVYTSFLLFIAYFIAAYFGAYLTKNLTNKTLEIISGFYFILIGIFFIWNSITGTYGENKHITHISHSSGFKNLFK